MNIGEFDLTAQGGVPDRIAQTKIFSIIPAFLNLDNTSLPQSSYADDPGLYDLVSRLELILSTLRTSNDDFEGKSAQASDAITQAIRDINLAISSNCGWSIVCLKKTSGKSSPC